MEVVKIENVTRTYQIGKLETHALRGVSLSINSGEFTALVGPSGSGKTTLLQMIGCLDQPTSGRVTVDGKEVTSLNRNQRADMRKGHIGFIFQFFALIPTLTAYENVEMPLLLNGHSPNERRDRVMELLKAVDLTDRANNRPDQLSGGQQQRIAIARALAPKPALILADEPTANLDTENGKQVMEIMKKLNQETGETFVFATHDPRVISYASRVVTLEDGVIVKDSKG
ncbi:MAG: ABC transporter ATP-binding protein [Anaerolineales bacterium]|jgi:putative ABC transport system ATP-binding protein|uniref:ABC transporter ATP-binding protein n=1 Tax=Candidatus Villigracilis vicinus TaxID=3140679 RepID=UPI0031374D50|nr:ABC transporter ATP-binding protein [Anaerolineales bacterium]MBK7451295.1 ABC transporter ATP-binding protein [Anaerolineales bacterium]MBK9779530.1 ABC transporter ATP-binding protein [Anaerolineales bacterium]